MPWILSERISIYPSTHRELVATTHPSTHRELVATTQMCVAYQKSLHTFRAIQIILLSGINKKYGQLIVLIWLEGPPMQLNGAKLSLWTTTWTCKRIGIHTFYAICAFNTALIILNRSLSNEFTPKGYW